MSTDLILKYVLLAAFGLLGVTYFMKARNSRSADSETEKNEEIHAQQEAFQEEIEMGADDDLALIAVITAALAAHIGTDLSGIKVSSIRRVVHLESGWAAIARQETIASRQSIYNL